MPALGWTGLTSLGSCSLINPLEPVLHKLPWPSALPAPLLIPGIFPGNPFAGGEPSWERETWNFIPEIGRIGQICGLCIYVDKCLIFTLHNSMQNFMMLIDLLYIYMENSEYLCDILRISGIFRNIGKDTLHIDV